MTILLYFHFGTFRNFKHYYLFFIKGTMKSYFPKAVSYNRFVELESRVFCARRTGKKRKMWSKVNFSNRIKILFSLILWKIIAYLLPLINQNAARPHKKSASVAAVNT